MSRADAPSDMSMFRAIVPMEYGTILTAGRSLRFGQTLRKNRSKRNGKRNRRSGAGYTSS